MSGIRQSGKMGVGESERDSRSPRIQQDAFTARISRAAKQIGIQSPLTLPPTAQYRAGMDKEYKPDTVSRIAAGGTAMFLVSMSALSGKFLLMLAVVLLSGLPFVWRMLRATPKDVERWP